jgi:Tfp pilus assembly protein PilF
MLIDAVFGFCSNFVRSKTAFACFVFAVFATSLTFGQGNVNSTGNGGKHIIQGSIYVASGRRASIAGLKVTLESMGQGDMSVYVDDNGAFVFRNLVPGSYNVVVTGSDNFEPLQEAVNIDDPGASSMSGVIRLSSTPRIINLHLFLQPKRNDPLKNEVLNAKLSSVPKAAVQHYERGLNLSQDGKDDAALTEFKEASLVDPRFALPYIEAGKIFIRTGRLDEAGNILKAATVVDPSDFDAHLNLGVVLLNKGMFAEAQTELTRSSEIDVAAVTPHYYMGLAYLHKKDLDKAQAEMETAKRLSTNNDFPPLHKYLGGIYWEKGKAVSDDNQRKGLYQQAVDELEKYVKLLPTAVDAKKIRTTITELRSKLG